MFQLNAQEDILTHRRMTWAVYHRHFVICTSHVVGLLLGYNGHCTSLWMESVAMNTVFWCRIPLEDRNGEGKTARVSIYLYRLWGPEMDWSGSHSRTDVYFDSTLILLALKVQVLLPHLVVWINVTWLITFCAGRGRQTRQWVLGIKSRSQVRKRGKTGLNQPLIHIHPFLPLSPQFLYLPFFDSVNRKISYKKKIEGQWREHFPPLPLPPQITPTVVFESKFRTSRLLTCYQCVRQNAAKVRDLPKQDGEWRCQYNFSV